MPISKRNRRGLVLLLIIGILVAYTPRIVIACSEDEQMTISFEEVEKIEEEIHVQQEINEKKKKRVWKSKYVKPSKAFDPNEYEKQDWMNLGLSEKQANVILKFSQRGLKSNEDLKKIFVIPNELFELVKDSTIYPEVEIKPVRIEKEEVQIIEINTANKEQLISLPGIGEFYASKIIEYRLQLGGYTSTDQLHEIWKFDENINYEDLTKRISVDGSILQKLDLNTATFDQLRNHPYVSYKVANSIVKMREVRGAYSTVEDILESKLIDRNLFNKIKTYLKVGA